jgi:L,D-transpeptidase catalytic domain
MIQNPGHKINLCIILIILLGILSCRQTIQVEKPVMPLPAKEQSAPLPAPPPKPSSADIALTAPTVEDLPPPVSIEPFRDPDIYMYLCPSPLPPGDWGIIVKKTRRELELYHKCQLLKVFPVDLGENPKGQKLYQGDMRTPEGLYRVIEKRDQGQTKYYLAFLLDYPNENDKNRFERALSKGLIPKDAGIGGLIEIHGEGKGVDWTQGCVALNNKYMEELFARIPLGTPVWIEP